MKRLHPDMLEWLRRQSANHDFLEFAALPLAEDSSHALFMDWLSKKKHAFLSFMERQTEMRRFPPLLGKDLKSAIVFLYPFEQKFRSPYVARYACGEDYHRRIKRDLLSLSAGFQERWGPLSEEKICVDTVPLLERSLAYQSGLGWLGKNGFLIHDQHGPFTHIAVWLLPRVYEEHPVIRPTACGNCRKCIDACPNRALDDNRQIDCNRCLSAWTIEHRGLIPESIHPHMRNTYFGCDRCAEVCPWNRDDEKSSLPELLPPPLALLTGAESDYRRLFKYTPLLRPGWAGLRRNLLICAHSQGILPGNLLEKHLHHPSDIVARTARTLMEHSL
ncbi:MAG: DUF1730 domain-containing protein [Planctomycetes bacterium]|nr:DUF1730 domain-containing protein [Planctomycetota bacterium]